MNAAHDFPYFSGWPVAVSAFGWAAIMAGLALAFASLVTIPARGFPGTLLPPLLFVTIPIVVLAAVTGGRWTALFSRVGLKQIGQMLLVAAATVLVSAAVAVIIASEVSVNTNPFITILNSLTWGQLAIALLPTIPQLVGEELLAILPFLALLWLFCSRLGMSRKRSIVIALIGSSLLFGAAHLPTYGWNWEQAFGIIGSARIVLTLAYIWTKNLWVSAGAHILNDWTEFVLAHALAQ